VVVLFSLFNQYGQNVFSFARDDLGRGNLHFEALKHVFAVVGTNYFLLGLFAVALLAAFEVFR